jgi:hypothetical protein
MLDSFHLDDRYGHKPTLLVPQKQLPHGLAEWSKISTFLIEAMLLPASEQQDGGGVPQLLVRSCHGRTAGRSRCGLPERESNKKARMGHVQYNWRPKCGKT